MVSTTNNSNLDLPRNKNRSSPPRDKREEKLRKLAKKIKDGTYKVDAAKVADRIIRQSALNSDSTDEQ